MSDEVGHDITAVLPVEEIEIELTEKVPMSEDQKTMLFYSILRGYGWRAGFTVISRASDSGSVAMVISSSS